MTTIETSSSQALSMLRASLARPQAPGNDEIATLTRFLQPRSGARDQAATSIIIAIIAGSEISGTGQNDVIVGGNRATVNAGDGDDKIIVGDHATVRAGRGNDAIYAGDYADIDGGDGDDHIEALDYATVRGGRGNDRIDVRSYADVSGGAGDDHIDTHAYAKVTGDAGNDVIRTSGNSEVAGGPGDDDLWVCGNSSVDGGSGDDFIRGHAYVTADGGSGNDKIYLYENATVNAGDGNDRVVTMGNSQIDGGRGNDTIIVTDNAADLTTAGHSTIDGGEGNDLIQTGSYSQVAGGTGDDRIILTGRDSTVVFNKGDGSDRIQADFDFTVQIGEGYSAEDVSVTHKNGMVIVSFKDSSDELKIDIAAGVYAKMVFSDGSTMKMDGNQAHRSHDRFLGYRTMRVENYDSTATYQTHSLSDYNETFAAEAREIMARLKA